MRLRVRHRSSYRYARQVQLSYHALHLTPRDLPQQRVLQTRLVAEPVPATVECGQDYFGNPLSFLTLTEPHDRLVVDAVSEVEVGFPEPPAGTPAWERVRDAVAAAADDALVEAAEFAFPSAMAAADPAIAEYAGACFPPGCPVLDGARELTRRIHADFTYDPEATSIGTPLPEVMRRRRGVCQDFALLQIAGLRALGLAARYVSGYIRNDRGAGPELAGSVGAGPDAAREAFVGSDASHAWVSVFCPDAGWVHYDPTNDLVVRDSHIVLAWGRDYRDVSPISGILMGGGEHSLGVEVSVQALG